MNVSLFLKKKAVWLSLLSLLGQMIIISIASAMLLYTDVSLQRAIVLVLVIIGFTFVVVVTLLRLLDLAKFSGLFGNA
ncbi:hypothetical protein [Methanolobus profundi]|uniref:Uncharacterized protein n=1 Tax=Methanolobus profundi TaxID=487685 RepID=A0A1I4U1U3_9EURY|nr:hypothetical protein [Methanolobus profundi]SFM82895.1 hypothetical protein SAMN04488696_2501 [Methanolobus profundi]